MWFDLNSLKTGSFEGFETEPGTEVTSVYPVYVPMNSFIPRKKRYSKPLRKSNVEEITVVQTGEPGIPHTLVFHYDSDSPSPIVLKIDATNARKVREYETKLKQAEIKIAQMSRELSTAQSGSSATIAHARKALGKSNNDGDNSFINSGFRNFNNDI